MKLFLLQLLCFLNVHNWYYYNTSAVVKKKRTELDFNIKHKKCKHCDKTMYRDLMPYKGHESSHWHLGSVGGVSEIEKIKHKRKNIIKKILKNG